MILTASPARIVSSGRTTRAPSHGLSGLSIQDIPNVNGLLPNTEWLEGSNELSPRGEIVVDDRGQTSRPGVFAAGDRQKTVPFKLRLL
jgi:alkyl hydroperoxide reductase subunit AhpF